MSITYVNGYANTVLSASVAASATAIPVLDLAGFLPNAQFQIYDGASTELLTVNASFTAVSGPGSLPISRPLAYAHAATISASALPPAVKQAAIFVTSAILKARGNSALVMGSLTPSMIQTESPAASNDLAAAWDILKPYRRIR